ncbi:MAG: cation:proton antiporter [Planctomycetes bacterium]|nr:cation:proton antiporter [Planctomycetota bacterium]
MPRLITSLLAAETAPSTVGSGAEEIAFRLLVQLVVILAATRLVTMIVRRLGQTDVSGEILAGILLGPSCLMALAPHTMHAIFHPSTSTIFVGVSQVGLVLLMFQIGLEFEFHANLAGARKSIFAISLTGIALPFAMGFLAAPWFYAQLEEPRPALLGFKLFFAIAMSITAIPVLGRIFMELGLAHTRTASLVIGSAAVDDIAGWLLLGGISLVIANKFTASWAPLHVLGIAAYLAGVFLVARPLLKKWLARHLDRFGQLRPWAVSIMLVILFCSAALTSWLGVFAIIGGFAIGLALHDDRRFHAAWKYRVSPLVNTLFLPVFFAATGLRTDLGSLPGARGALILAAVCAIAFTSKFGGAWVAARAVGETPRSALTIGVAMNTRGLMELIVLNIGYDLGVLPKSMFTMLVIMAMISTFLATPLIRMLMKGQEREEAGEVDEKKWLLTETTGGKGRG